MARTARCGSARSSMVTSPSFTRRTPSRLCHSSTRSTSAGAACGVVACANPPRTLGERISRYGASMAVSAGLGARGRRNRGRRRSGRATTRSPRPPAMSLRLRLTALSRARSCRAARRADAAARTLPTDASARRGRRPGALRSTRFPAERTSSTPPASATMTRSSEPRKGTGAADGRGVARGATSSGSRDMAASTPSLLKPIRSPAGTAYTSREPRAARTSIGGGSGVSLPSGGDGGGGGWVVGGTWTP